MTDDRGRRDRIGRVITGVIKQAVADARADGVLLLAAERPESPLARAWCEAAVGKAWVISGAGSDALTVPVTVTHAGQRLLVAHPASKTTLLLMPVPAAGVYPLGDLYGSELLALAGEWQPPDSVRELAALAGGAEALDGALRRWAEERRPLPEALGVLSQPAADGVRLALDANRYARSSAHLVPKLTSRTVGIDLRE